MSSDVVTEQLILPVGEETADDLHAQDRYSRLVAQIRDALRARRQEAHQAHMDARSRATAASEAANAALAVRLRSPEAWAVADQQAAIRELDAAHRETTQALGHYEGVVEVEQALHRLLDGE